MRRRATASKAIDDSQPFSNGRFEPSPASPRLRTEPNPADRVGNVRRPEMSEEGVGGPEPVSAQPETQRPTMTDLGSASEATSDDDEERGDQTSTSEDDSDEDSDSDDSDDEPGTSACRGALARKCGDPNLAPDGCPPGAVVPAVGGFAPHQQATNVATYGNITVKDSSGIHFGNKTIYHGPVIIEQHVYGSKSVKQIDDSLQLKIGGGPLAITDGSEVGEQKRTGLQLGSGSFRIGPSSTTVSKSGSGFLWRHLLGGRPGSSTWVAWAALCLGCVTVLAVILMVTFLSGAARKTATTATADQDTADIEADELSNGYKVPPKQQNRTVLSRRKLVVVPRREWVAQPPKSTTLLKHPVEYVVISHTATESCTTQAECTYIVRYQQVFHVESKKWMDIAYNFMVAGDGQAYEGRGWDVVGAHTAAGFNSISIGISFVGTFESVMPPPVQIRACKLLIEEGVKMGKISPNYKLIGDRQVSPTKSPGDALFEEMKTWEHWTSVV
ncbi:peptidoglycan-recognition protein LC-like [Ischnura elegans]|uniref:peptidoglycan-recognition protein LC-like n=1 Tax=Ischnura elegans TaxID=197161 RepID=UPI001ED897C9|nr:peptidoglycan-recognition protein LC-like [Ischnura elegans]